MKIHIRSEIKDLAKTNWGTLENFFYGSGKSWRVRIALCCIFISGYSSVSHGLTNVCRSLNFTLTNASYTLNNVPGSDPTVEFEINVTRANNATLTQACTGFVAVGAGANDSPSTYYSRRLRRNTRYIPYNYYTTSTYTNANVYEGCSASTAASHYVTFTIPVSATSIASGSRPKYIVRMPSAGIGAATSGTYTDSVSMRVYEGSIGDCSQPGGSRTSTISYVVDSTLSITAAASSLSFGELAVGDTVTTTLSVVHNGNGFRLGVRSENASELRQANATAIWDYQMRFKRGNNSFGSWRTLSDSWTYYSEITQNGGSSPVTVTLESQVIAPAPTGPLAGTYTDTVYFEVTPY